MKGWLDKYVPKAQNGIEGTMGGLTDKGFNYSPAWGGQFAMGGNIPGSVGFTYARTGDIPDNGKYAKKTLPSAQNGRSLLETISNFIPVYETYVDVKDAILGGLSGDRARMNQGILGLGAPFAGKALTGGLDYTTEKTLGKDVADYNEMKRNTIVNMSQSDRQKLFEKYGPGGYDKWVKAGKPKLENGGSMSYYQEGLDFQPKTISQKGSLIPADNRARGDIQSYPQIARMKDTPQRKALAEAVAKREQQERARRIIESQPSISQYTPNKELEAANRYKFAKQYAATHGGHADDEGNIEETFVDRAMDSKTAAKAWDNIIVPGFEAEMLISSAGLVGQGLKAAGKYAVENTALKNAYKLNPLALKENPEMFLYRARPVGQDINMNMAATLRAKESAGEPLTWWQKNLLNPQSNPEILAREKYYGQWFEKDPSRLDFYINPNTRNFADNDVIEILRTRLPKSEAAKLNVSKFPDAKALSASPETEFILPKNMVNSAERFPQSSWEQLILEDKKFNTPHWLKGYKEVPKPTSVSSSIENVRNVYPSFKQITNNPEYIDAEYLSGLIKKETDWLNNPEYIRRKMAATGKSEASIKKESEDIINHINNTSINYTGKSENIASGVYSSGKKPKIEIFNGEVNYPYYEGVLDHEVKHAFSETAVQGDPIIDYIKNKGYKNYPKTNLNKNIGDKIASAIGMNWENLAAEQQVIGRRMMDLVEKTQGLKRGTILNRSNVEELINQIKKENSGTGANYNSDIATLMSAYKKKFGKDYPKKLTEFLNKAWVSIPAIAAASAVEQKKKGGIIKDNRGQWAHPGEITQIDSNDITMQGVPYPVLGIGADGQRIMMEPGEDYRFNKGPVTEIPMAQAGKRVPIVVSDPKDPRLKAYNDSLYTYKKGFELAGKLGSIFDKEYGYDKTTKEYKKRLQNLYEGKTGKYTWNTPSIGRMSDKEIQKEINYYDKLNNYEKQVASVLKEYLKLPVKNFTASYSPELPTVLRYKKPVQPVEYRKPEPIVEKPVEKPTQKVVEKPVPPKPMNKYEGRPLYAPGAGVGGSSPLVGFIDDRKGDTTYIQPEDYERFAVDPRGRKYIESKKKLKSGGSVNNVDAQPLKKLDQLTNFTNYNKPTKGGWLDKYN